MSLSRFEELEERLQRMDRRRRFNNIPVPRLKDRSNPLEDLDEVQFRRRFHMHKSTVHFIFNLIKEDLRVPVKRGCHIPPIFQLCIAIRFYVTDAFQIVIGDLYKINQSTVSRMTVRVSTAIAKLATQFIRFLRSLKLHKSKLSFMKSAVFLVCYI